MVSRSSSTSSTVTPPASATSAAVGQRPRWLARYSVVRSSTSCMSATRDDSYSRRSRAIWRIASATSPSRGGTRGSSSGIWPDLPWWTTDVAGGGWAGAPCRLPEHAVDHTHDRAAGVSCLTPDALERLVLGEAVALHQQALGALDPRAAIERAEQVAELTVALDRDVDAAGQLRPVGGVEVGEDAAAGGLGEELAARVGGEQADGAARLVDDLVDQPERMVGVLVQRDDREVRTVLVRRTGRLLQLDGEGDHLVAEPAQRFADRLQGLPALVGEEQPQALVVAVGHPSADPGEAPEDAQGERHHPPPEPLRDASRRR